MSHARRLTFAFAFTTLAGPFAAIAQSADRVADVKTMGTCSGCVLEGQGFTERRLMGIKFASATLTNMNFSGASMNIAVFDDAVLRDVNFDGADLKGASFVGTRLENVTFDGADLSGAVFEGAVLLDTDLQRGRLCNTQLPDDIMDESDCQ